MNTACPPRRSCVRRMRRPPAAVDKPAAVVLEHEGRALRAVGGGGCAGGSCASRPLSGRTMLAWASRRVRRPNDVAVACATAPHRAEHSAPEVLHRRTAFVHRFGTASATGAVGTGAGGATWVGRLRGPAALQLAPRGRDGRIGVRGPAARRRSWCAATATAASGTAARRAGIRPGVRPSGKQAGATRARERAASPMRGGRGATGSDRRT